jgi:phage-related holin
MAWAIAFDLATGLLCGIFTRGGVRARLMTKGATVKALSFALVIYLGRQEQLIIGIGALQMSLGAGAAIWYGLAEWVSVVENLDELGAPVPPFIRTFLAKAQAAMDRADLADRAATALFGDAPINSKQKKEGPDA